MSASGERRSETSIKNLKSDTAKVSFKRVPSQKTEFACAVSGAKILQNQISSLPFECFSASTPPHRRLSLVTIVRGANWSSSSTNRWTTKSRLIGVVCHTLFGRHRETIVTRWFSSKRWVTFEISGWIAIRSTARRCRLLILFWTSNCYCHAM